MKKFDIAVVGAGPAGLSFVNALCNRGLKIALIEAQSREEIENPKEDGREIALTHLSCKIMQNLGIWGKIKPAAISLIKKAKVFDGDDDYSLNFGVENSALSELGYMVPNFCIRQACFDAVVTKPDIHMYFQHKVKSIHADKNSSLIQCENGENIQAQLVIGADSRFSATRRMMGISADMHDFGRSAIVCRMSHEMPHNDTASECFHYQRTLAILPLNNNISSVVITLRSQDVDKVMMMDDEMFNTDIATRFKNSLGEMKIISPKYVYPLVATYANKFYAKRFALIGDAAVGMHPVTAHGFNLGLQSAHILAQLILTSKEKNNDFASDFLLRQYNRKYRNISRPLYLGTNSIVGLFTDDRPLAKILRQGVLRFGNRFTPLKKIITKQLTQV